MKRLLFLSLLFIVINSLGQETTIIKTPTKPEFINTKVFYSQKVINTKSVEVLPKGIMEFNVAHNFGDVGGVHGGIQTFYGLDNIADVRIGFQIGLTDNLNVVLARIKGSDQVQQQYELGVKYQFLKQAEGDSRRPLSLTMYVNDVIAAEKRNRSADTLEDSFKDFGDRHSQIVQLLVARKFNKISLQLNPLYLHTNHVQYQDDESIFALGGAIRLPLSKKLVLLADYFHPFRSASSKEFFADSLHGALHYYDPIGVGFEIITEGHVFHLNFTNARETLENRFIRHTVTGWGNWEFRWAFTLSRNFVLFRPKRTKAS